jgi:hypothetical protein
VTLQLQVKFSFSPVTHACRNDIKLMTLAALTLITSTLSTAWPWFAENQ